MSGMRVELAPGPPAWAAAVAAPVAAVALVAFRLWTSGLRSGPDDPVPPVALAVFTVALALVLSWRALTQRAVLDDERLVCRNLAVSFEVGWDRVEELLVVRRPGVVVVELRVRHLRRRHRIGAATRFAGPEAEAVLDVLRAHPATRERLVEPES